MKLVGRSRGYDDMGRQSRAMIILASRSRGYDDIGRQKQGYDCIGKQKQGL